MNQNPLIRSVLGLVIAISLVGARTEKIWVETLGHLDLTASHFSHRTNDREPFDPARVPQSGGMASRLLGGIKINLG
jgi:hypothetical protein